MKIMLDTRGITGYQEQGGKLEELYSSSFGYLPEPQRKLRIAVIPVRLRLPCYNPKTPSGHRVKAELENLIPLMLPLRDKDLEIVVTAPYAYSGSAFAMLPDWGLGLGTMVLLNGLATDLAIGLGMYNASNPPYDFCVAVMASGNLGGADGASLVARREILFVDETKPAAALHEMGHALGLYTGSEQYNTFPPFGLPVAGCTTFLTDGSRSMTAFAGGDQARIRHHPPTNSALFDASASWYDLMGDGSRTTWPIPDTLAGMSGGLHALLLRPSRAPRQADNSPVKSSVYKNIILRGAVERYSLGTTPPTYAYRLVEGSIRAFERGPLPLDAPPANTNAGGEQYILRATNASGSIVEDIPFCVSPFISEAGSKYDLWAANFMFANDRTQYSVLRASDQKVLFRYVPRGTLSNSIQSPTPGSTLGTTLTVRWTDRVGGQTPPIPGPNEQPLQHAILVSPNGSTSWTLQAIFLEGNEWIVPSAFMAKSTLNSIRVFTCDGYNLTESRINGLRINNRPPTVEIESPRYLDRAAPGTLWVLKAFAWDVEDGLLTGGVWRSSRDGRLGSGNCLDGVVLSAGAHTLYYAVSDRNGTTVTASVPVSVGTVATVDLALTTDSLSVSAGRNPSNTLPVWLERATTHAAVLTFRNAGRPTTASLALYLMRPGQAETLAASRTLVLQAFEPGVVGTQFVPAASGNYRFRGVIQTIAPTDSNPANNQRSWTFSTLTPPRLAANKPGLDFGIVNYRDRPPAQTISLTNLGQTSLRITQVQITGPHVAEFAIVGPTHAGTTLATSQSVTLTIRWTPLNGGHKEAAVRVTSTDPASPQSDIWLRGTAVGPASAANPELWRQFR